MKNIKLILAITLPLFSGCGNFPAYFKPIEGAKIDTGVVDYRYTNENGKFTYHFFPEKCLEPNASENCEGKITEKNRIHANDSVSINLLYGYICDFPEDARSWQELKKDYGDGKNVTTCWDKDARAGVKGEVSILATVFELDGKRKISFSQGEAVEQEGRVVYYNEDVRETGQPLNLSNIPMYGPVSYHGKPIFLRFAAVELDQKETKETGTLLRSLADLGSKAYPPASPVLSALDKVGGAFLKGQQDDLFFKYEMMFNGDGGTAPVVAPLSAGIMSFVRVQNRSNRFNWDDHCVNQTTGVIHISGSPNCRGECLSATDPKTKRKSSECKADRSELRGLTYFTIQVTKNEPALSTDAFQTFAELKELKEEDVALPNAIKEYAEELGIEVEKTARFDRARSQVKDLYSPSQVNREKSREAVVDALCLGFNKENTTFVEDKRLSPDKRYKLLKWLEEQWLKETEKRDGFDASPFFDDSNAKTLCADPTHEAWKKLIYLSQPA